MITVTGEHVPSVQQGNIFAWFDKTTTVVDPDGHLVVVAYAGCGKTSTIIEGVKRAPERKILVAAFSKIIQEELQARLTIKDASGNVIQSWPHIHAKTLHAVGFACIRRFRDRIRVEFNSDRADSLTEKVCDQNAPDAIKKLVSKLHTKGREIAPHATTVGQLTAIGIQFECEPEEQWSRCRVCGQLRDRHEGANHPYAGYDLTYVEEKALAAMELAANLQSGETIDGSDMIFLPVRNGWLIPEHDLVVIDEAQDMTTAQLEVALGVLKPGGRVAVVGDPNQAIFAFRGADSGSIARLQTELQASELGLSITYRCGRRIVRLAQSYVPDFEAGPNNSEGSIETMHLNQLVAAAGPGNFVLSRVNAPLVSIAMQLLKAGKRTRIAGKDIGAGLRSLIRKMKARTVPELIGKIETWATREKARLTAQLAAAKNGRKAAVQNRIDAINDQADMMVSLTEGAKNVTEVENRITNLFTDDGLGEKGVITCSSVHRAKGLEADKVFILKDTLRDYNDEERNIAYVAITRAKHSLVWVESQCDEREREPQQWEDDRF